VVEVIGPVLDRPRNDLGGAGIRSTTAVRLRSVSMSGSDVGNLI